MRGHGEKFDRLREVAIAALLKYPTIKKAAESCGIGQSTLRLWLQDEDFQADYRAARRELLERSINRLVRHSSKAIRALVKALESDNDATRVRAADLILVHANRGIEALDFTEELKRLQRMIEDNKNAHRNHEKPSGETKSASPPDDPASQSTLGPTQGEPVEDLDNGRDDCGPMADEGPEKFF